MKSVYLFLFLFFATFSFSRNFTLAVGKDHSVLAVAVTNAPTKNNLDENSTIQGTVVEEATGKPLAGVQVAIIGTKFSTKTDASGKFYFRKMPSGQYILEFSLFTFSTKIVEEVVVVDKETTFLNVSLTEFKNELKEVVIKRVKAKTESVQSLLTAQKNSIRVSDGISAESIRRTPDRTTSDVLKRVSGTSIQDNKFVIVRGLNDRYNTTYLNGSPLPSTEPDRKAFSFDIFPANMLDNLVIYKTASPDLPGEFAGGVIEITTKSTPDKNFQSISVGGGYNTITTGKFKLEANDIKVGLPGSIQSPTTLLALQGSRTESNLLQIVDIAKNYQTNWGVNEEKFAPNNNFQFTFGRYFKFKGEQSIGILASVTNTVSNLFAETSRKSYEDTNVQTEDFNDKNYVTQKLTGATLNLSLKINSNNKFNFKNLYSENSEIRFTDRIGTTDQREPEPNITISTNRLFTKNKIFTSQLGGEHFFPESKIKMDWVGSYSNVQRDIPSERRNTYNYFQFSDGTQSPTRAEFNATNVGRDYPGSIFTAKNDESIFSSRLDLSKKINLSDSFSVDLKIGGITQERSRTFQARQLGYIVFEGRVGGINWGPNTFSSSIAAQPNATIFSPNNMGIISTTPRASGLTLFEATRGSDFYTAESGLNAGYLMIDNAFKKLRIIWGARLENFTQKLDSEDVEGNPVNVDVSVANILPSVNFIYGVTKTQNIRLSGSKTVNRPEFREIAPFLFYDNVTRFNTDGNPTLKVAEIYNADLRYEIFPGKGQLISASLFYKDFTNPIELVAKANNSNRYENAGSATNFGFELEFRLLMSSILGTKENKFLDDLTLFSNLAVIRSEVDISNLDNPNAFPTPLQGQSPYVFNAGLQYLNKELGWSFSANVNRVGDRIVLQANQTATSPGAPVALAPGLWEKARTILDFQITKNLFKNKIELKLNVQNVLAQDLITYQNNYELSSTEVKGFSGFVNQIFTGSKNNVDGYDAKIDDLVWRTLYGQTFSLTATYNF